MTLADDKKLGGSSDSASSRPASVDAGEADIEKGGATGSILVLDEPESSSIPVLKYDIPPWYLRVPFALSPDDAPPPNGSMDTAQEIPDVSVNWFSQLTFQWIQPMLNLGYARPLETVDLWKMDGARSPSVFADRILDSFKRRHDAAQDFNRRLAGGEIRPPFRKRAWWTLRGGKAEREQKWREQNKQKASLLWAMNDSVKSYFWWGGLFKIIADTSQITSPLVIKALIKFASESYVANIYGLPLPHIGRGIGLAIALLIMQEVASLAMNHAFHRGLATGIFLRSGLITAIYSRALRFTNASRSRIPNGKLVNHISTDVSRIDFASGFFHFTWTAPIQMIICLILLLINLGPSALVGFAFFIVVTPLQAYVLKLLFAIRRRSMLWTDKRVKLLQELLPNMRILKYFAWEKPFMDKVGGYRKSELKEVRGLLFMRSVMNAFAVTLPVFSAVVSFIVYAGTGHKLQPDIIFTSLTLFQLLRLPLLMLPVSLGLVTDSAQAISRLQAVFEAELIGEDFDIPELDKGKTEPRASDSSDRTSNSDEPEKAEKLVPGIAIAPKSRTTNLELDVAIRVSGGAQFTWDGAPPPELDAKAKKANKAKAKLAEKKDKESKRKSTAAAAGVEMKKTPTMETVKSAAAAGVDAAAAGPAGLAGGEEENKGEERVFKLKDVDFSLPRGKLCAVVGPVGSGKSSLLQALLGEMRCESGHVSFGGKVSYAPQTAWIQGASIRDNILFGRPFEEEKYWKVIEDASLVADLDMLDEGDRTEVGEKGISLSGGQKQRINIARALYNASDICMLDDPFSALDAHVGKHVFEHAVKGSLAGKTRVIVTHALHFLPQVDYIITLDDGRIAERGTYEELIAKPEGAFAKFVAQFGGKDEQLDEERAAEEAAAIEEEGGRVPVATKVEDLDKEKQRRTKAPGQALMQAEDRATGAVKGWVYKEYFKAARGTWLLPCLLFSVALSQGASVMSSYWLVYWQERKWDYPQGFYMGLYAAIGFTQSLGLFMMGCFFALMVYYASVSVHQQALNSIFHSPMSFFDTTPIGRIMNRFSKDIDTLDNTLGEALRQATITISQIIGAIILIAIIVPYFLIPMAVLAFVYYYAALFYRSSARELKRLDAILRSLLYSHFSESLAGLSTIRAYGDTDRFVKENRKRMDDENRAYWLTITNQRWLGLRLDLLGALLTFCVAILTVAKRTSINPNQTGVILSYILTVQQSFGWLIRQTAEVENDMNSVERILHYASKLEQESPHELEEQKPPADWPQKGQLVLKNVVMSYRAGLPPVLKGLNLTVNQGEHIGIVGRTGAGKSSIMVALYRLVELTAGSIEMDDIDISKIGLADLRRKIAIIPQDPTLFSGTIRSNLDPFGVHEDAQLWDALRRSSLVDQMRPDAVAKLDGTQTPLPEGAHTPTAAFTLDTIIEEEGSNLSVGQRSLVSLARALVKNSRVVMLDEATASVDYETDQAVQQTIEKEFADHTILCIAHRIKTIIGYDRICVMDAGQIAELDTPENLYNLGPEGIFRSMCDRSQITLSDIRDAAKRREKELELAGAGPTAVSGLAPSSST